MGGRPNYICRCQSVVNNPESPPRPAPATTFHSSFFVFRISSASSVLSNRQDVGAVHGMRLAAVQGEEASSGSYFRRGLRVRATLLPSYNHCCYLPSYQPIISRRPERRLPGHQTGAGIYSIFTHNGWNMGAYHLWLGNLHQKLYLYLKLSIVASLWVSNSERLST